MNDDIIIWPHAPIIEKQVLSVLFQWPEKLYEAPGLSEDHFHSHGLGEMFRRVREHIEVGKLVNGGQLVDEMARSGNMDRIGGLGEFNNILSKIPTFHHFTHDVQTLTQFLARRMALTAALEIRRVIEEAEDIQELTDAISAPITAIHDTLAETNSASDTPKLVTGSLQRYLDRCNQKASPMGQPTGIDLLDNALKGLKPGRIWVIGAYPSGGKSVMGTQILVHAVQHDFPGVMISLEMPEEDCMDRILIQAGRFDALAFTDPIEHAREHGATGPTELLRREIQDAARKILTSNLIVRKPGKNTLSAVCATIRRAHREKGSKLAVVDYVGLVRQPGEKNKEQELTAISHTFQELAQELGMHIILLSQLNPEGDTKHGRVIEEDADAFIQIVQEMDKKKANFKQHQYVLVVKDRHGSSGGQRLELILNRTKIRFEQGKPEPVVMPRNF